jgi:hypothetical protein
MLRWFAICGESLEPDYQTGDYALAACLPGWWQRLRPGDVVVLRHAVYGMMVKRIEQIDPQRQEITVIGSHPESIDSRTFGPLPRAQILGKVIWHVRKPQ